MSKTETQEKKIKEEGGQMRNKKGFIGLETVVITAVILVLSIYTSKQIVNINKVAMDKIAITQDVEDIKNIETMEELFK